jgi:hypothetical protein
MNRINYCIARNDYMSNNIFFGKKHNFKKSDDKKTDRRYSHSYQDIEKILLNENFGLPEIKEEVRNIEDAVFSKRFGLEEIKEEVSEIERNLNNPLFGIKEIKLEVAAIEVAVFSNTYGLAEIKSEVSAVRGAVFSCTYGLKEIKEEVKEIEYKLDNPLYGLKKIKSEVNEIEGAVFSNTYGLAEIKSEIKAIEGVVFSHTFGLAEIKSEVKAIEGAVFSVTFGLQEIETEIIRLLANKDSTSIPDKTTGPVIADALADRVMVKIFNNNLTARTAGATVYNLVTSPKSIIFATGDVSIAAQSALEFNSPSITLENYEVEFTGLVSGVYGFTASCQPGTPVQLIASNTFRHNELVPAISNP